MIVLVALLVLPMGMAAAPANAEPTRAAASGHCDEHQQPPDAPAKAQLHCVGCLALPVIEAASGTEVASGRTPTQVQRAEPLSDVTTLTDPPPPKHS